MTIEWIVFQNFLIALALGTLIGLEREYARYKKHGHDYAGIRTFPLICLFGALSAYFAQIISVWILIISLILMGIMITLAYIKISKNKFGQVGLTSEIAGFITFLIGVLCSFQQILIAVSLSVIMTIILYYKAGMHHLAQKMTQREMTDTLKFALIGLVILPLLPNKGYGPYEIFNPYIIWLMVVFVSGISFIGYILIKWLGERGIILTGILGGLASSTATTTNFAQRSKKEFNITYALVLGVVLANSIMFFRLLLETFVLNRKLFWEVITPILILSIITIIFAFFIWFKTHKSRSTETRLEIPSPLSLTPALKFGLLFALILALTRLSDIYLSSKGIYLISFISGFVNLDAITISLSQLAKENITLATAKNGLLLAAITNIAVKGGIAYIFGSKRFKKHILTFTLIMVLSGIIMILFF